MHVKSLDGARGVAAGLVAVDHFILLVMQPDESSRLHAVAAFMGSFGVGLFFLISGFVIPQTLRRGSWDYAARRVFRIYPVAIAGAVLALGINWLGGQDNGTFLATITLVGDLSYYNADLLMPIFWTLTIEVAFYVLAGLIGRFTARGTDGRSVYYVLLGVLAATIVIMKAAPAGSSPLRVGLLVILCCWPMLLIGWFCYLLRSGSIDQPLFLLGTALAFVTLSTGLYPYFGWRLGAPSWLLAFVVFSVLVFGRARTLPRVLSRPLASLGVVTFSLYVVHVPIADGLARVDLPLPVLALAYVAAVAVLSVLLHWVAEKPGIALGKRVAELGTRLWGAPQAAVAAPVPAGPSADPMTLVLRPAESAERVLPPVPTAALPTGAARAFPAPRRHELGVPA